MIHHGFDGIDNDFITDFYCASCALSYWIYVRDGKEERGGRFFFAY